MRKSGSEAPVKLDVAHGVGWIRIDRPEAANSIDIATAQGLLDSAVRCDRDEGIRAIVLTGTGSMFCAGGDLTAIHSDPAGIANALRAITARVHSAISIIARTEKPVMTAINGTAAGAGVSLAINSDYAVACHSAKFKVAFTDIGLSPDSGTTFILPRLVGLRRAQELMLRNPTLTADEAQEMGLISRVIEESDFADFAATTARDMAAGPTRAFGAARRLLLESWNQSLETQLARESELLVELGSSRDATEGIEAFLGKRVPQYLGK